MNNIKVAQVIPYFLPSQIFGGPVTAAYELSKALVNRGHEVHVYTTNMRDHNRKQKDFLKTEVISGIHIHRTNVILKFMSYFVTPSMINRLNAWDFDVIHAHGYRNFQTDIAASVSLLRKKPFVITLHGMFAKDVALERGFEGGQKIYNTYDFITRKFSLKTAKVLIANSQFEYGLIPEFKDKTRIIHLGVDSEKFKSSEKGRFRKRHEIKDEKVILYVGRISRGKNIELLIESLKNISSKHNVRLIIAGEELHSVQAKSTFINTLIELAQDNGVANKVIFTGGLYGDDLLDAYTDADVFVNPSLAENFGLTNLEAAASSLPVVAFPVGITPELLKENDWLLFKTEKELSNILDTLLQDEEMRRKIGEELRKKVEREYTWDRSAKRVEEVYNEISSQ